jgi:phenylpropionate dioxygenase-like ring-hydroxylating dioxygenase large terminal subunit
VTAISTAVRSEAQVSSLARDSSPDQFEGIRKPLREASHTPGYIYYSPAIQKLEKERIFCREWLCIARAEEIANPGDYLALRIVGEPIIVARNLMGQIRCFANLCRHRGVEIAQGNGNAKYLSCPYHAWTYDLDGQLVTAGFMKESTGFDPKTCRLKPIAVEEWAGWVFVNLSEDPLPLSEFIGDFAADVGLLRMQDCMLASKLFVPANANWKFVVENVMDIYHSRTLHYNTFGKHRGPPEDFPFQLRRNGGTCTIYTGAPKTAQGKTLFGKMPALESQPHNFAISCHLSPNVQLVARVDNVQVFVAWPVTETTSELIVYNLFAKEFADDPEFAEKVRAYDDFIRVFLAEDSMMLTSLQKAMATRNYVPGRLSTLEIGIHHLLNNYLSKVLDRTESESIAE